MVDWLDARLQRCTPTQIAWVAAALWLIVISADILTGPQVALSIFYLAPIAIVTWYLGWHAGLGMAAFGTMAWFATDFTTARHLVSIPVRFWNAAVRGSIFLVFTYSLAMLRHRISVERTLARTDALTDLPNWRHFSELALHELAVSRRYRRPVSVAYLDVDNFKSVNDNQGHDVGDALLSELAAVMRGALRVTDIVARVGGDEFVILLPEQDRAGAQHAVLKLQAALEPLCVKFDGVGFSIGVVTAERAPHRLEPFVKAADSAMYNAKTNGKAVARYDMYEEVEGTPAPASDVT